VDQSPDESAPNQRQSAAIPDQTPSSSFPLPPSSRRGGRRPGAGAPRGNLNALKHGRRSRQFAAIGAVIASSPATVEALLALARRKQTHHRRAEEVAADLIVGLFNHARDVAHGKTSPGPFADIARLNVVRKALSDAQSAKKSAALEEIQQEIENHPPHNQPRRKQSHSRYKTAPD
jgi:hypothetical protein